MHRIIIQYLEIIQSLSLRRDCRNAKQAIQKNRRNDGRLSSTIEDPPPKKMVVAIRPLAKIHGDLIIHFIWGR